MLKDTADPLANAIRAARLKKNLSQKEVAVLLDLVSQAISSWERGKSRPTYGHMVKLARLLGADPDEWLDLLLEVRLQEAKARHVDGHGCVNALRLHGMPDVRAGDTCVGYYERHSLGGEYVDE